MSGKVEDRNDLRAGDVLRLDNGALATVHHWQHDVATYQTLGEEPFLAPVRGDGKLKDVTVGLHKIAEVYRGVITQKDIDWGNCRTSSSPHDYRLTLTTSLHCVWDRSLVEPEIEIDVKINGKTAKLSEISEETLLKLREEN